MDKKLMSVSIVTKGGNEFEFADTVTTSDGTSAARSLAQHTLIDAEGRVGGIEAKYIIPYMAIDNAFTVISATAVVVPADDNCVVEAESGTLKITNTGEDANIAVYLELDGPATYSGIEFTESDTSGLYIGTIHDFASGASFTFEGIPDGTVFHIGDTVGTVPSAVTVGGSPK